MKCRKCAQKAVINMRQHRLALCKDHYLDWFVQQTARFIKHYQMFTHEDNILISVSGGKDSLALWDVLVRLDYHVDGVYLDLGIDGGNDYSLESRKLTEKFANDHKLNLHIIDIEKIYGNTIPAMVKLLHRVSKKPCSVCGLTKRHEMNRVAFEMGYSVLVTGHNLDDEVAVLFSNTLNWSIGHIVRQGPILEASKDGLARKAKPFCRFYERETAAYALLRGIDYIYDECPYSEGSSTLAYKEQLTQLELQKPGTKLRFYLSFLHAKEAGLFTNHQNVSPHLNKCTICGQPTTSNELCTFCRTITQVSEISKLAKP